jgi:hypothetical protein
MVGSPVNGLSNSTPSSVTLEKELQLMGMSGFTVGEVSIYLKLTIWKPPESYSSHDR